MNFHISQLNEVAQVVSKTLKHFNPSDMFWSGSNCVLSPNFNHFKVEPLKDLKKPFGVQSILESFAKSLGFNTYNGLLNSGINSFQLRKDALQHLNPSPLNPFYTNVWEVFTTKIMEDIINGENLSVGILSSFKRSPLLDLMPYANGAIFNCVNAYRDIGSILYAKPFDVDFSLKENSEQIFSYYPVACSIYYLALEKLIEQEGYSEWFINSEIDVAAIDAVDVSEVGKTLKDVKLNIADMLVKNVWNDSSPNKFFQDIVYALRAFFSVRVSVGGEDRSPLDRTLTFKLSGVNVRQLMLARVAKQNFDNYKAACAVLMQDIKGDDAFYTHLKEPTVALKYSLLHINHDYYAPTAYGDFNGHPVGNKVFWLNIGFQYITPQQIRHLDIFIDENWSALGLSILSVEDTITALQDFLSNRLQPATVKFAPSKAIGNPEQYQQTYILQTDDDALRKLIPKVVSIESKFPLKHYLGEIYIQRELAELLDVDIDEKLVGHPDVFEYATGEKITINKTRSPMNVDEIWSFTALPLVLNLALYLDYLDEKVLGTNTQHAPTLFAETESDIYFSVSMKFLDVLYKFRNTTELTDSDSELAMLAVLNKATQKISLSYYSSVEPLGNNIPFGYDECPNTQQIYDYLISIDEIHELIYKYFMQFYTGKMNYLLDEADVNDTVLFEIFPHEMTLNGVYDINDIIEGEVNYF